MTIIRILVVVPPWMLDRHGEPLPVDKSYAAPIV